MKYDTSLKDISRKTFSEFFGRFVTVKLTKRVTKTSYPETKTFSHNKTSNVRITFDVQKYPSESETGCGKATIVIYNLDDETMKWINDIDNSKTKIEIELYAGNGNEKNVPLIYKGVVNTQYVSFDNNDLKQYLCCYSYVLDETKSKTYNNVPLNMVAADVLTNNGFINAGMQMIAGNKLVNNPIIQKAAVSTIAGAAKLVEQTTGLKTVIDNAKLKILNIKENLKTLPISEFKIISRETGLINSPTVVNVGLELVTMLRPDIEMFDKIYVDAPFANYNISVAQFDDTLKKIDARYVYKNYRGFFNKGFAYYVSHQGDTHENLWRTTIRTITQEGIK